jgi:hypothetical protein
LLSNVAHNLPGVRILLIARLHYAIVKLLEAQMDGFILILNLFEFLFLTDAEPPLVLQVSCVFVLLFEPFLLLLLAQVLFNLNNVLLSSNVLAYGDFLCFGLSHFQTLQLNSLSLGDLFSLLDLGLPFALG